MEIERGLQLKLGQIFLPSLAEGIRSSTSAMRDFDAWLDRNRSTLDGLGQALASDVKLVGEFTRMLRDMAGAGNSATESVSFLTYTAQGMGFLFAGATDIVRGLSGAIAELWNTASYDWAKFNELFLFGEKATYTKSQLGANLLAPFQSGNTALTAWHDSVFDPQPAHVSGGVDKVIDPAIAAEIEKRRREKEEEDKADKKLAENRASAIASLKEEVYALMWGKDALEDHKMAVLGLTKSKEYLLKIQLQLAAANRQIVADEMATIGSYNGSIRDGRLNDALKIKTQYEQTLDPMAKYEDRRKEIARLPFLNVEQRLFAERQAWEELTEAGKKYVALRAEGKQIEDRSMTTQEKQVADLARLDAMLQGGVINLTAYRREWLRLQQEGTSTAGLLADAWTTSVNGMGTAFANFVTTGKGSFKSLVSSILADLARLEANKAFASLLSMGLSALGSYFNPDVVSAAGVPDISGLPKTGGTTVDSGIGYTPPSNPMIAPSGGGKGGIQTSIIVNVNSDGQASSKADTSGRNAAALGQMIDGKVKQIIVGEMRPGGLLNPVGGTA